MTSLSDYFVSVSNLTRGWTMAVYSDSIATPEHIGASSKIRYVSCASLIGEAIRRIANEESVSKLFD